MGINLLMLLYPLSNNYFQLQFSISSCCSYQLNLNLMKAIDKDYIGVRHEILGGRQLFSSRASSSAGVIKEHPWVYGLDHHRLICVCVQIYFSACSYVKQSEVKTCTKQERGDKMISLVRLYAIFYP